MYIDPSGSFSFILLSLPVYRSFLPLWIKMITLALLEHRYGHVHHVHELGLTLAAHQGSPVFPLRMRRPLAVLAPHQDQEVAALLLSPTGP